LSNKSRTQNSARNMAVEVTQKIVAILFTFVSRQIFLQVLTVEHLGVNVLFVDILAFLSLADLGLSSALAYNFFKPLAENDEIKLAALSRFYSKVYKIIAVAVAAIGLALIPFLRQIIRLETDLDHLEIYYLIALINVVLSFLFVVKAGIISADQHRRIVTMYRMVGSILSMTLQIIVLLTIGSFMLFLLMPLITTLATNLLMARKASKMYPYVRHKATLEADDKKTVFKSMKSVSIYRIANFGILNTDNILISTLVGTAVVGKYSNYVLAVTNLQHLGYMAFSSVTASIGNLVATESPEKRLQIFKPMQMSSFWLSGFFCFCLFFLLDDFILLWLGEEFVFGFYIKLLILLACYLSITRLPIAAFREPTGFFMKTKYVMLTAAIMKIALSIFLGIHLGLVGILIASLVTKLSTFIWYEPMVLFRDYFESSAAGYFYENILNLAILAGCITIAYFILPWQEAAGWGYWVLRGIACTVFINSVYFLRYFRTPEFSVVVGKVKTLVKK